MSPPDESRPPRAPAAASRPASPRAVPPRTVLGVDPGSRVLGWGVVAREGRRLCARGHGALRSDPRQPMAERLAGLVAGLRQVVEEHAPDALALEEAFHGRDARAALRLGEARGAVLVVAGEAGLAVAGYANNVVKQAVTGAGRATKERVRAMVARLLGLERLPTPLDASDALALAICHLERAASPLEGGGPAGAARLEEAVRRADAARARRRGR